MTEARPLVVVAVGLVVGGVATFAAARLVTGARSYEYATVTALFGAVGWGVLTPLLGEGVPGQQVIPLLAWVGIVKWRYLEPWLHAVAIGVAAWASVLVGLALLRSYRTGAPAVTLG